MWRHDNRPHMTCCDGSTTGRNARRHHTQSNAHMCTPHSPTASHRCISCLGALPSNARTPGRKGESSAAQILRLRRPDSATGPRSRRPLQKPAALAARCLPSAESAIADAGERKNCPRPLARVRRCRSPTRSRPAACRPPARPAPRAWEAAAVRGPPSSRQPVGREARRSHAKAQRTRAERQWQRRRAIHGQSRAQHRTCSRKALLDSRP